MCSYIDLPCSNTIQTFKPDYTTYCTHCTVIPDTGVPYSMYVRTVIISNFGPSTKNSSKPRKRESGSDRFYFEAFLHNTPLVRRAFDLCLEGLSWESYDQRRGTYLS